MLRIRAAKLHVQSSWLEVHPGQTLSGLCEDTDYAISVVGAPNPRFYIDDVEILPSSLGEYLWRPCFYAGQVLAEVIAPIGGHQEYRLDISPAPQKSGQVQFNEMVQAIREFDAALLGGASAATMAFGHQGSAGLFTFDILLARLRAHGSQFLDAVEAISRKPHLSITGDSQVLPLSRIRKIHPTALRDRRLVALATGGSVPGDELQTIQLRSATSSPTFDTPANQTLLALMKRFRANVQNLRERVATRTLGIPTDDQESRINRRLHALDGLWTRVDKLIVRRPFSATTRAQTLSSGLTQIAAQPIYSRAYRLGGRALAVGVEGTEWTDELHVNHSWGIYETWCYLAVLKCVKDLVAGNLAATQPDAALAIMAFSTDIGTTGSLEILFQANFPSAAPSKGRLVYSISRMRIPDIVLVYKSSDNVRSMVLDAKWRSGRESILEAMESAHIYHDSLRIGKQPPSRCILLCPGKNSVSELEQNSYISENCVGAISDFNIDAQGLDKLKFVIGTWLGVYQSDLSD